jgi:hypothetical protein
MKKILFCLLVIVALAFGKQVKAQALAQDLQSYVDLPTGNFNYSIPLLSVSGPNGESFPVVASYQAGVKVDQEASWLGLGWDIPLGEITREINGIPDDWKGKSYQKKVTGVVTEDHTYYGPVHFHDMPSGIDPYNTNIRMDVFASKRSLEEESGVFEGPDYDHYYVSGPGISGEIKPYLFDFANLFQKAESGYFYGDPRDGADYKEFSRRVQFRFRADGLVKVKVPFYDDYSTAADLENQVYQGVWKYSNVANYDTQWNNALRKPTHSSLSTYDFGAYYNPNISDDRQRVPSSRYVEYFTNKEIYEHYTGANTIAGFVDFDVFTSGTCNRNSVTYYDPDGIGAFRITMPNGMVYHYSLPVYTQSEINREFLVTGTHTVGNYVDDYVMNYKYANSWKLTAITGVNYVDKAPLNVVDPNDEGYWIKLNYKKWNKSQAFFRTYPFFNCNYNQTYSSIPAQYFYNKVYPQEKGTVQFMREDIYYVNSIQSPTQTAYFIKDTRDDDHGKDEGSGKMPKLRLTDIVLLDNEDAVNYFQSPSALTDNNFLQMSTLTHNDEMVHKGDYLTAQTSGGINSVTLRSISFEQDYSLTRFIYNNVLNDANESTVSIYGDPFEAYLKTNGAVSTTGNSTEGGKLTLKGIYLRDFGNNNVYNPALPAYQFTYNSGDKNPDYDPDYKDFYGYYRKFNTGDSYKQDHLSTYSKDYVDAWSLSTIRTPLGGEIDIEYESDAYDGTYYKHGKEETGFAVRPLRGVFNGTGIQATPVDIAYGGGLRVTQLSTEDPDQGIPYVLTFDYQGGKVGTEPDKFYVENRAGETFMARYNTDRLAPPSTVYYKTVKVTPVGSLLNGEGNPSSLGSTEYLFRNHPDNFKVNHLRGYKVIATGGEKNDFHVKEFIGITYDGVTDPARIERIRTLDRDGEVLKTTRYYYTPVDNGGPHGSMKEIFYKTFEFPDPEGTFQNVKVERIYTIEERSAYLRSITTTEGNAVNRTTYRTLDTYTGLPTEIKYEEDRNSSVEQSYTTNFSLAYKQSAYAEMSLKSFNPTNKNILSPRYEFQSNRLASSKGYNQWSKHNYIRSLNPNGAYEVSENSNGIWHTSRVASNNGDANLANWDMELNNTLYDENMNLLETRSRMGIYSATAYAGKHQLPVYAVSGSNYKSAFHCSFEYTESANGISYFEGEVRDGSQQVATEGSIVPHTGEYMAKFEVWGPGYNVKRETATVNGESVERGILPGREYEVSAWVHNSSPAQTLLVVHILGEDGQGDYTYYSTKAKSDASNLTIGNWTLVRQSFTVPDDYISPDVGDQVSVYLWNNSGGGYAYADDFRLQPLGANLKATVFDIKRQLPTYLINNENFFSRLVYDPAGKVIESYQETESGEKIVTKSSTHYAQ